MEIKKYLKPSPRKRSFKKDSLKTKNDLKKKNIQPSFNNVLFNNHRIPFPSFSVSSTPAVRLAKCTLSLNEAFCGPTWHFFKKLRNRWDGKFEKPPDTVQLMVYCWFGARWFGFLGSPKMKPPGPKPTSNHQLTPVFHQKKKNSSKKKTSSTKPNQTAQTVGIFGEVPTQSTPAHPLPHPLTSEEGCTRSFKDRAQHRQDQQAAGGFENRTNRTDSETHFLRLSFESWC